ncbi:MAG: diguanylate cyclase [Magnetococcales bacterium]|nr:diguanylate cyclase [Magnetococcales bacterium]MBF0149583.1 diguanylate cyclase [Magnetococcales bacterium]MBF0172402.1 diguanylate cyclase [Magnetococcales bacterium]MBF0348228.1 diguanylate cyclase [Magnetococcales bacterium]MBF0631052.1 diguanylate cyclase [Magnetococcales bacterium]
MYKILIVEDSRIQADLIRQEVQSRGKLVPVVSNTFSDAKIQLQTHAGEFFAALLDINLPDAPHGEVVDLVITHGIPAIVFTGEFSEGFRGRMIAKRVVDYVIKGDRNSIPPVVSLVERLIRNRTTKVLVVDDSRSARSMITDLLSLHKFHVLEAENGAKALEVLTQHPDIRLVITDYNMPQMDGFELTREIRRRHDKSQLAIIGLSSHNDHMLSARFLKRGANDFITKPFLIEEFFLRVGQNVEIIEHIHALKGAAMKDFLTGLPNRRHFMEEGTKLHVHALSGTITLIAGTVDVDFFKKVNDTYGHEAGDQVLKMVAATMAGVAGSNDLLARIGGEEFAILLVNQDIEKATGFFERLRETVESLVIPHHHETLRVTISIGVSTSSGSSLAYMLDQADQKLYDAKRNGRNRVEIV